MMKAHWYIVPVEKRWAKLLNATVHKLPKIRIDSTSQMDVMWEIG